MTDSSTIQQARDVLARWKADASDLPWSLHTSNGSNRVNESNGNEVAADLYSWDAVLIVGTAGNPDLLDAIDEGLRQYGTMPERSVPTFIKRIAAAVIIADERMTSAN